MDADDSIECGPTAPALELPWFDPDGRVQYVELRSFEGVSLSEDIETRVALIPEAQQFPALRRFLAALNSEPSAWMTAKCDAWNGECVPEENLYDAIHEQGSYVDIVLATPVGRADLELHRRAARKVAQQLEADGEGLAASAEIVVRRCYFHSPLMVVGAAAQAENSADDSISGYALTIFLTGYGGTPTDAASAWEQALDLAAHCLIRLPHTTSTHNRKNSAKMVASAVQAGAHPAGQIASSRGRRKSIFWPIVGA